MSYYGYDEYYAKTYPTTYTVYTTVTYPAPVVVPYEVVRTVYTSDVVEVPAERSESSSLRAVYVERYYPSPVVVPREVEQPVYTSDVVEVPAESSESVSLKPVYREVTYPVGPSAKEVVVPVYVSESSEVLVEHSEVLPYTARGVSDVKELRDRLLPLISELEASLAKVASRSDLINALSKFRDVAGMYRASGVADPDIQSRLDGLRSRLEALEYLVVLAELSALDLRSPEQAKSKVSEIESWLQTLPQYGVSVPTAVADALSSVKSQIDAAIAQRGAAQTKLAGRDREVLDFLAGRLARLYTIAEFVSRDTWERLRSATGLTDENIRLVMRYVRGEKLSDEELRRLAELYTTLQYAGSILDHEAILREIEKTYVKPSTAMPTTPELAEYYDVTPRTAEASATTWSLADLERRLKEDILKGKEPQVSPGRQVVWSVENALRLADVLGRGQEAVSSFLKGLGVPPAIASGIASFLVTFGTVATSAVPVVGAPVAAALIGLSLANSASQLLELASDEYERSLLSEEFSRILDPSKAPPELRAQYEAMRQELIGSIAGAVAGGVSGYALRPIISEKISNFIASRNPKLAQKLSQFKAGELVPKEQEWDVKVDTKTGEVLVARYEKGAVKVVGKFSADPRVVVALGKGSQQELVTFAEKLARVTGKSDVSEELRWILGRLSDTIKAGNINPTDDLIREALNRYGTLIENLIKSMPEELKGRSLLEVVRQVNYVNAGGRLVPALDLGEKMVLSVGDKTVTVTKGALAAVNTAERLRSLGVFEDVVNLLKRGGKGLVYRPDLGGLVVELTEDGKLIVRAGARVETLTAFDPRYLLEARQLLESADPNVIKALSAITTAPHTIVAPPTTSVAGTPADIVANSVTKALASAGKVASSYETVVLSSGGKTASVSVLRDIYDKARSVLVDVVFAKNLSGLRSVLGPQYERYTLFTLRLDPGLAGRLAEHLSRAKGDVLHAVSEAMKTASGSELAQLKILQAVLQSGPNTVIPVLTASTSEGLTMVLATAVPALAQLKLTAEDIRRLGLDEKAVTEGLKAVYVEKTYPVAIPRVTEVVRPAYTSDRVEVPLERSESVALKPQYQERYYPAPKVVPLEVAKVVQVPDVREVLVDRSDTILLKPQYVERSYPVAVRLLREVSLPVYVPDVREVPLEKSETIPLRATYIERTYPSPVVSPKEVVLPVYVPDVREVPYEVGDVVNLRSQYVEVPYPAPRVLPQEVTSPIYLTDVREVPIEVGDTIRLKPQYVEVPYPVPRVLPQEISKVVHVPDVREVPYEVEESKVLEPAYIEKVYEVPVVIPVEVVQPVAVPEPEPVEIPLTATQAADVHVETVEVPTFEVVYMPYSQPLPVPPELAGMLAIPSPTPTAPQTPPLAGGELPQRVPARKAREVEKIVL